MLNDAFQFMCSFKSFVSVNDSNVVGWLVV